MPQFLPGVKHVVAVASGKGGVGKSTVSANLAFALAASGLKAGLMDADVYGPSIPTILGITEKPAMNAEERIVPVEKYGMKVISTGFFVPKHEAVVWRGPMLHKMIQDLLGVVDWGELDYLVIDLPPGTGDVQLSLCQSVPLTGAVIVSTPQDVAWNVAQKAILMFDKLNTPVLGVVENMTGEVFGSGGARRAAERLGLPFFGEVPLAAAVREGGDRGEPLAVSDAKSPASAAFTAIAKALVERVKSRSAEDALAPAKVGAPGGKELLVQWKDGTMSILDSRTLRLACPCAACVDEVSGQRTLRPETVPADVVPQSVRPVGRYALQIVWSDGHDTGLYGFEYLRKIARPS